MRSIIATRSGRLIGILGYVFLSLGIASGFTQCYYPDGSIPLDYFWELCTGANTPLAAYLVKEMYASLVDSASTLSRATVRQERCIVAPVPIALSTIQRVTLTSASPVSQFDFP
jgi:hypothetical protein